MHTRDLLSLGIESIGNKTNKEIIGQLIEFYISLGNSNTKVKINLFCHYVDIKQINSGIVG